MPNLEVIQNDVAYIKEKMDAFIRSVDKKFDLIEARMAKHDEKDSELFSSLHTKIDHMEERSEKKFASKTTEKFVYAIGTGILLWVVNQLLDLIPQAGNAISFIANLVSKI